jgi:hypothetical protein
MQVGESARVIVPTLVVVSAIALTAILSGLVFSGLRLL